MDKLRFALVGCGNIARKHAHVVHNYLDEAEIGAFVDRDGARAAEPALAIAGQIAWVLFLIGVVLIVVHMIGGRRALP